MRALAHARPTRVLVLEGGADFFSNGIHLHDIEASADRRRQRRRRLLAQHQRDGRRGAGDAGPRLTGSVTTVALLRGNAGAGGCWLAFAADLVWSHAGVVLNLHYKNMGNLYGSGILDATLPRRVGGECGGGGQSRLHRRLPMGAREARARSAGRRCIGRRRRQSCQAVAHVPRRRAGFGLRSCRRIRSSSAARRGRGAPAAERRAQELQHMHRNFYGFDPATTWRATTS